MIKIITDAILLFFAKIYQGIVSLIPTIANVITSINEKINTIIDFFVPIFEYVLYYFNVPILLITITLITLYLVYVFQEYIFKLVLKYVTRLL